MQSWGRWLSRGLVAGALTLVVVVAWRYEPYLTVFGETPCKRDGLLCDDAANRAAQRDLGLWMLGGVVLLAVGLVLTAVRRSRAPRTAATSPTTTSSAVSPSIGAHAGVAVARGILSVGAVVLTVPLWLLGGTALYLALGLTWVVLLAWLLDRSHRVRAPGDGELKALVSSTSAAAVGVVVGCLTATVTPQVLGSPQGLDVVVLLPVVLALGTGLGAGLGVLAARLAHPVAPAGVLAAILTTLVAMLLTTANGRDLARDVRDDLYPSLTPRARAAPDPVISDPIPDGIYTPAPERPPTPTPVPVVAGRPCVADDLELAATGWDSAMGSTAVSVVATNRASTACWVRGYPGLRLEQGGQDLRLDLSRSPTQRWGSGDLVPDRRVGLAAGGGRASFDLWWRGYRTAADGKTSQTLVVTPSGAGPLRLGLAAPYLLDVVEGAEVTVMRWKVPSLGSG